MKGTTLPSDQTPIASLPRSAIDNKGLTATPTKETMQTGLVKIEEFRKTKSNLEWDIKLSQHPQPGTLNITMRTIFEGHGLECKFSDKPFYFTFKYGNPPIDLTGLWPDQHLDYMLNLCEKYRTFFVEKRGKI